MLHIRVDHIMKAIFLLLISVNLSAQDTLMVRFDSDSRFMSASAKKNFLSSLHAIDTSLVSKFEVIGHTDSDGGENYNYQLGQKRANTIAKILIPYFGRVDRGIFSRGEGDSLVPNNSESNKALNRRVEVVIYYKTDTASEIISKSELKVGKKIVIEDLNFIGGEAFIVESSKPVLLKLLRLMQNNPTLEIRLEGHVCCSPPNEDGLNFSTGLYNLSEARAQAVYQFLIDNGISPKRMSFVGLKGDHRLVPIERTEMDRLKNRRVEMVITHY